MDEDRGIIPLVDLFPYLLDDGRWSNARLIAFFEFTDFHGSMGVRFHDHKCLACFHICTFRDKHFYDLKMFVSF